MEGFVIIFDLAVWGHFMHLLS